MNDVLPDPPRRVTGAEAAEISRVAIESKATWGYTREFIEACRDELTYTRDYIEMPGMEFWCVDDARGIAGFYGLSMQDPQTSELDALFVRPDRIGSGLGKFLIEHAKSRLAELGANTLVIQGDPNAEGFYTKAGGVQTGTRESESIPDRFLPVYEICLDSKQET